VLVLQITVENISQHELKLIVDVPAARLDAAMENAYRKLVKRYKVPGFRPGRAPRHIFERHVGRAALFEEATDDLVPRLYEEAIREKDLTPYEEGTIQRIAQTDEGGLMVEAKVLLKPKVVLPDLKTIDVPFDESPLVTDEQVDRALLELRRDRATLVPEDEVGEESYLTLSGDMSVKGGEPEAFSGQKLYVHDALAEIREALMGAKVGEERRATFTQEGTERTARFHIDDIGRPDLPPVDEALAEALGYQGLEDMRQGLTNYLETSARREREESRAKAVLAAIEEQSGVEIPEFLVEREIAHQREHHGAASEDEAAVRERAKDAVRRMLIADELLETAHIKVSAKELRDTADRLMASTGRRDLGEDELRTLARVILDEKLTTFLARLGKTEEGPSEAATAPETLAQSEKGAETP